MSPHATTTDPLVEALFSRPNHHSRRVALCTVGAVMIHALTASAFMRAPETKAEQKVFEVELLAPPPPPAPPPVEPKPEPKPSEIPKAAAAPAPRNAAPPPPAAAAGALLTAKDDAAPGQAAPFDFTSDPNSAVWGSGVVAVGGTAKVGVQGATPKGRPSARRAAVPRSTGDDLVAFKDLSRRPQLTTPDPCRGYFPASAMADSATVVLRIVVTPQGRARSVQLVSETPTTQGFGAAARACISSQTFVSALDKDGKAVPTSTSITVRFRR